MQKLNRILFTAATAMMILGLTSPAGAQPAERPQTGPESPRSRRPVPTQRSGRISPGELSSPLRERPLVEFEIEHDGQPLGTIVLELHQERVPGTVANFLHYIDSGFYNGTIFHRILPDFVIQGGGFKDLRDRKVEGARPAIRNEGRMSRSNARGAIGMARKAGDPHSAVSQFYINVRDNKELDPLPTEPFGYCVFGEVVEGMEVVDRIRKLPTRVSPEHQRRFLSYREQGMKDIKPEKSEPFVAPVIKRARQLPRQEYEARKAREAARVQPPPMPVAPEDPPLVEPVPPGGEAPQPQPDQPQDPGTDPDIPPEEPPGDIPPDIPPEEPPSDIPPDEPAPGDVPPELP